MHFLTTQHLKSVLLKSPILKNPCLSTLSYSPAANSPLLATLFVAAVCMHPLAASADDTSAFKPWLVRAGASLIVPKSDNGSILNDTADVTIGNQTGPSVTLSYFFSPNWAVDLLGGLPFKHQIDVNGSHAGETKHLPPILSLQYHFLPDSTFRPFVGVGINYTTFLDEKLDSGASFKLSDSWGAAFQAGFDYALNDSWSVGADARYVRIKTDAEIAGANAGEVTINPAVYTVNIGYRF